MIGEDLGTSVGKKMRGMLIFFRHSQSVTSVKRRVFHCQNDAKTQDSEGERRGCQVMVRVENPPRTTDLRTLFSSRSSKCFAIPFTYVHHRLQVLSYRPTDGRTLETPAGVPELVHLANTTTFEKM